MKLTSVNIGQERPIRDAKGSGKTGIYKVPVEHPVLVTEQGLAGDFICDKRHHGGVDQAVYIYGARDYDWWFTRLGEPLSSGTFGENLTIGDLESARFSIGDCLHIGAVVLEVTAPRIPCATLAARMNDPAFVKSFRQAERPGLYCRVIQPGYVQAGDLVTVEPYTGQTVTVIEMFREYYAPDHREETIRRYLNAPIAIRARQEKEQALSEILK
jgi:MOSC domain-containing protein YiiM